MKLLFCPECTDIVRLFSEPRTCRCGKSSGRYVDDNEAVMTHGIPIGIGNDTFTSAIRHRQDSGNGTMFGAFVFPVHHPSVIESGT